MNLNKFHKKNELLIFLFLVSIMFTMYSSLYYLDNLKVLANILNSIITALLTTFLTLYVNKTRNNANNYLNSLLEAISEREDYIKGTNLRVENLKNDKNFIKLNNKVIRNYKILIIYGSNIKKDEKIKKYVYEYSSNNNFDNFLKHVEKEVVV